MSQSYTAIEMQRNDYYKIMEVRSRRSRECSSPDRAKMGMQPMIKPIKKVQVVYYLTRNGQLEHPHYMEITHLANQPLRLKDVMDRLTLLRGKGTPLLYSWSCKRSYKNGYVWNDLAENDVIYPADGAEYVLKGSELLEACLEIFQQFHVSNRQQMIQEPTSYNLNSKPRPLTPNEHQESQDQEDDQVDDYNEEDEEKTSYTSSTTPRSRCSRGVSTDELDDQEPKNHNPNAIPNPNMQSGSSSNNNNNTPKRFENGDPAASEPSRNTSLLLQIISCGSLAVAKAKRMPSFKQPAANVNNNNEVAVKKRDLSDNLHKGVVCRSAVKVAEEEEDNMIINYMPENPRFGNFQSEEKEYFSGSIVESTSKDQVEIQPVLKKSNSYKEERTSKAGMGEAIMEVEEEKRSNYAMKVKCIPRKKSSSSSKKIKIED